MSARRQPHDVEERLAPEAAQRAALPRVLEALAVLAEPGDSLAAMAAVELLQRRLGVAVTGEPSPELLTRADAAALAAHADAHARAALTGEEAAALYEQIAADREAEIATSRARHPSRPTSLTEEEVASSLLAAARSALTAANHWRRAAAARAASRSLAAEVSRPDVAEAGATARSSAAEAGAGTSDASKSGAVEVGASTSGSSTSGASTSGGSPSGAVETIASKAGASTSSASKLSAAEAGASTSGGSTSGASKSGPIEAGVSKSEASASAEPSEATDGDLALAWRVRAAQATSRARRAAEAAGPWFRSAIDGHLAAGDRLQGSRALEGALKAAALVADATAVEGAPL